jgi:hypothetical protein
MQSTDLSKSTQNIGNIRAKDSSILVTLVDCDRFQILKKWRPLRVMILEDAQVQHVWIRQKQLGLFSYGASLLGWRATIVATD